MKATRLQQIEGRVKRLRELMDGDSKELLHAQKRKALGIAKLRRA